MTPCVCANHIPLTMTTVRTCMCTTVLKHRLVLQMLPTKKRNSFLEEERLNETAINAAHFQLRKLWFRGRAVVHR